jgi:hypothetical protein
VDAILGTHSPELDMAAVIAAVTLPFHNGRTPRA